MAIVQNLSTRANNYLEKRGISPETARQHLGRAIKENGVVPTFQRLGNLAPRVNSAIENRGIDPTQLFEKLNNFLGGQQV